ncbi:heparinase [Erythrobacter litoralis]|uniref:heparinase II/III family protein n=1 Tax=Erythrobacter litoralis TaxID=39960 RepID=UPI002434EA4F|nr:heparinase II/III-family protein [Erythrobacter litoralis]MDG6079380.1 heparinase [Erythrobacter litoralis]
MNKAVGDLLSQRGSGRAAAEKRALPLGENAEPLVVERAAKPILSEGAPLDPSHSLVLSDLKPRDTGPIDAAIRWAYRMGVPGAVLCAPLRKPAKPKLLGTVDSPLVGDRAAGMALRAGQLLVAGMKVPIKKLDYRAVAALTPPFLHAVHGFTWMRDLAACAPRTQCAATAGRIFAAWNAQNRETGKGPAWTVEHAGLRVMAWLVHAPLVLSGEGGRIKPTYLAALETNARWLDRKVSSEDDRLAKVTSWAALVAAGLLLPDGKPRRLYAEAGLLRALGELVCDDGGVLSRSPSAQIAAIEVLIDLRACYEAVGREPLSAIETLLGLMIPALLALRMGDRGLGCWQGSGAISAERMDDLVAATGVRARALNAGEQWGYQRARAQKGIVVLDAAPPPRNKHARHGCASTLAFEFSHEGQRIIVNCGGAEYAGALVPARIEQGLRGTAAHSTLVLDDTNSTAVLIKGQIGKGVEEVDIARSRIEGRGRKAIRLDAAHNGYVSRFGLSHRRRLVLAEDGLELLGEDVLEPTGRSGKRGKIGFAMRFHLGRGVEAVLSDDRRGAALTLPDGTRWQFRLGGEEDAATLSVEDSLWVDGSGRPHGTKQLVAEGLAARGGGSFPWLLKRMG